MDFISARSTQTPFFKAILEKETDLHATPERTPSDQLARLFEGDDAAEGYALQAHAIFHERHQGIEFARNNHPGDLLSNSLADDRIGQGLHALQALKTSLMVELTPARYDRHLEPAAMHLAILLSQPGFWDREQNVLGTLFSANALSTTSYLSGLKVLPLKDGTGWMLHKTVEFFKAGTTKFDECPQTLKIETMISMSIESKFGADGFPALNSRTECVAVHCAIPAIDDLVQAELVPTLKARQLLAAEAMAKSSMPGQAPSPAGGVKPKAADAMTELYRAIAIAIGNIIDDMLARDGIRVVRNDRRAMKRVAFSQPAVLHRIRGNADTSPRLLADLARENTRDAWRRRAEYRCNTYVARIANDTTNGSRVLRPTEWKKGGASEFSPLDGFKQRLQERSRLSARKEASLRSQPTSAPVHRS